MPIEEKLVIIGNIEKRIAPSMTRKMYSWSKWGGANMGLVQETRTRDWACQACGQQQTDQLPAYMFEFLPDEFIRICTQCQFLKLQHEIEELAELLRLVRHPEDEF